MKIADVPEKTIRACYNRNEDKLEGHSWFETIDSRNQNIKKSFIDDLKLIF